MGTTTSSSPGTRDPFGAFYDSNARLAPVRGALKDLYTYRALVRLLVVRELTVRYKRSLLGISWTLLTPYSRPW